MTREFSRTIVGLFKRASAPEQGGLLNGRDPTAFNPHDPIRLWIIQVGIIILTASLLSLGLRKLRQPKVIAEVLGGIILGPTAFGAIPGFTEHIFPDESRSYLSLVANIGLCLFLFIVGLEIDGSIIKRNARLSTTVAFFGMVIPFGLGVALAVPLYNSFIKLGAPHAEVEMTGPDGQGVQFTHFMLFTGVAYSITAFPVLCRILTELKLLDTTVGIVVLSAGVGNDIIGWVLLALSVALVNAGSGLTALWILLTCVGWTIFMLVPVKIFLYWLARKTGSLEGGPTVFFMTATMLIVFGSAFFTDIIGVHAIFGAFIAGLIVPRRGGLAIALTEKLEDMVAIIFLPLYFTLSGLSTNLRLLNDGITWGYTIAIIILAFVGKFGGCALSAKYFAGFNWREAGAIGSLMSCKGLVELIVLNVGLSAGILSPRVFSMFVLEALLLTFITTPLVTTLYPSHLRVRIAKSGANFNNVADDEADAHARESEKEKGRIRRSDEGSDSDRGPIGRVRRRFAVVLDKLEHLPGVMAITQLIQPPPLLDDDRGRDTHSVSGKKKRTSRSVNSHKSDRSHAKGSSSFHAIHISALRLLELTDRHSAVMKSSATDVLLRTDAILAIYRTFVALLGIQSHTANEPIPTGAGEPVSVQEERRHPQEGHVEFEEDDRLGGLGYGHAAEEGATVSPDLEIVKNDEMPLTVKEWAWREEADVVIIPWALHNTFGGSRSHNGSGFTMTSTQSRGVSGAATPSGANTPKVYSSPVINPFDALFGGSSGNTNTPSDGSARHSTFVRGVFAHAGKTKDVGLFVDMNRFSTSSLGIGLGIGADKGRTPNTQHIFLPFVGGPDDRLALSFVVQLCMNPNVTATVMRLSKTDGPVGGGGVTTPQAAIVHGQAQGQSPMVTQTEKTEDVNLLSVTSAIPQDTVYGRHTTETRMQSETADNIAWAQSTTIPHSNPQVAAALTRIEFKELATPVPLHAALQEARSLMRAGVPGAGVNVRQKHFGSFGSATRRLIVVTGRSRRLAVESHHKELKGIVEEYLGRGSGGNQPGSTGGPTGLGNLGSGFSAMTTASSGGAGSAGGGGNIPHPGMAGEVMKTVGEVGTAFVVSGVGAGVLVLQAAQEQT